MIIVARGTIFVSYQMICEEGCTTFYLAKFGLTFEI